ncbi:MATE family efflux transporter [Bacteroides ihuae]|uniref:MATE family efflux transporter n=1 Tax=Bacteroides ihuae TaxID=1852362 RepID=UPI0008DB1FE7|nr:MATE family efflux transporter [Bacteroides ihuae]
MALHSKDFSVAVNRARPNLITIQLIRLALPVIASSFMTMAYNSINIIFVGKFGSEAVAAVGSAGFYMNLSWGVSSLLTVGAGIKVSHAIGEGNIHLAKSYVKNGIWAVIMLALLCSVLLIISRTYLIGLIQLNNPAIEKAAAGYLLLIAMSIPFLFQNLFFTSIFIGYGDSRSPFRINATALIMNILLDFIFIFQIGLGIRGAAIATILSQATATLLFYRKLNKTDDLKPMGTTYQYALLKDILKLGLSPTIQRISFTAVAIMMARIISDWGATAIAVQKVGIQIEAISFMTAGGFVSALSTISGQAYGAKDYRKQWTAFRSGMYLAFVIGSITSVLLITFPGFLFSIFLSDTESIAMGREYLTILGFSQLFMCMELMATGAFFGWGRTNIPAITGILFTVLRIPMALIFIDFWQHSLSSVWWSISISSIAKGVVLVTLYIVLFKLFIKKHHSN